VSVSSEKSHSKNNKKISGAIKAKDKALKSSVETTGPVSINPCRKLIVAISSRALFNLDESNEIFENKGLAEYIKYQIDKEDVPLNEGPAFQLIKRLLDIRYPVTDEPAAEIILISKNDPNTGLRVFNSIEHYKLDIKKAAFTCGRSPYEYLKPFKADLFLSANQHDVRRALQNKYAAATILSGLNFQDIKDRELRIAFDGDAVLFSDEAESIFQEKGLQAFDENEKKKSHVPLPPGPFKNFLEALNAIQQAFSNEKFCPIRIALITARHAPAHKRAINTLRHWGIGVNDAFFLGGMDKVPFLKEFLLNLKDKGIKIGLVSSGLYEKAWPEIKSVFQELELGNPADFYDGIIGGQI